MKDTWDIRIAIVSDLHCHEEGIKPAQSWLIAGAARKPVGQHPVQALKYLIKHNTILADVLVCPGDLADRISRVGMVQAWDHLGELSRELKSKLLITTLGNHDVDCYKNYNSDPFSIPRNLVDFFPVPSEAAEDDEYWSNGFYFVEGPVGSKFLVLNTVIGHHDEATAKRGTFDHVRIERLGEFLSTKFPRDSGPSNQHRIAVMHHHPLLHSSTRFSSSDVLEFGDQLLELLSDHGFRFIVHGHRHDPRISRLSPAKGDQFVLAAGSFSAVLGELSTSTRNLFHIANLSYKETSARMVGEVLTWEYNMGIGWRESTIASAALPHISRFCSPRPQISLEDIKSACLEAAGFILRSSELYKDFPDMFLLLPDELTALSIKLRDIGIKLTLNSNGTPEYVGIV